MTESIWTVKKNPKSNNPLVTPEFMEKLEDMLNKGEIKLPHKVTFVENCNYVFCPECTICYLDTIMPKCKKCNELFDHNVVRGAYFCKICLPGNYEICEYCCEDDTKE